MLNDLIVCRSLTYAQRTAAVLKQAGVTAWLTRTPREISGTGCGYSVGIPRHSTDLAAEVLRQNRMEPRIYRAESSGRYREVVL